MRVRRILLLAILVLAPLSAFGLLMQYFTSAFLARTWAQCALMLLLACWTALACMYVRSEGRHAALMVVGASAAIIGVLAFISSLLLWFSFTTAARTSRAMELYSWLWAGGWLLVLCGLVAAQWGLLSLLRLDSRLLRLVRSVAQWVAVAYLVAVSGMIATGSEAELMFVPLVGALAHIVILVALLMRRRRGWKPSRAVSYCIMVYMVLVVLILWQWDLILLAVGLYKQPRWAYQAWVQAGWFASTVVVVLVTMTVPVLAMLEAIARRQRAGSMAPSKVTVQIICPRCRGSNLIHAGTDRCPGCGLSISLQVEEPRCECGYLLYQLHQGRCPECGRPVQMRSSFSSP